MERKKFILVVLACAALLALLAVPLSKAESAPMSPVEKLGKMLFYDTNLSEPKGEACAACHGPEVGFMDTGNSDSRKGGRMR